MTTQGITPQKHIWLDGKLVDWEQATVHVTAHALHYGYGAFEGIRSHKNDNGDVTLFRLDEHIRRLFDSAKILMIPTPFSMEQIREACLETLRSNGLGEAYLRPLVFVGEGPLGFGAMENPTRMAIIAFEWGAYLGEEGMAKGIRCKVSSFTRHHVNVAVVKAKAIGQYTNAILAKREAVLLGFDEAIFLDVNGYVTEASGQNLFCVRDGVVKTAPTSSSLLPGITRATVIELCKEASIPVVEEIFTRDELYIADEVFLCGTASEVCPVREVDHRVIGPGHRGPITQRLQELYRDACRAGNRPEWNTKL